MGKLRSQIATTVFGGVFITLSLFWIIPTIPAIGILGGMTTIIVSLLIFQDGRKQYAVVGTVYFLALGLIISLIRIIFSGFPSHTTISSATLLFGFSSSIFIGLKVAGIKIVKSTLGVIIDDLTAERLFDSVASLLATASLFWTISHFSKKATTHGGFGIGGSLTFLLSLFGFQQTMTFPVLNSEIDIILFIFIGCMLAGFYTLESTNSTWIAAKQTASKTVETSRKVHSKTSSVVKEKHQNSSEEN